jgi:hypothetical protein
MTMITNSSSVPFFVWGAMGIFGNLPVTQDDRSLRISKQAGIMSGKDEGCARFAVQPLHNLHHLFPVFCVQIRGGFIGQDE